MMWLAVAALALLPFLALREINETGLAWLRDRVLWGVVAVAAAAACAAEPWLTPIAVAVLARWAWQGHVVIGSVVSWAAIGGAWFLAAELPSHAVAYALLPGICYQAALASFQWGITRMAGVRSMAVGLLAQRTFAASLFALAVPLLWLLPWWAAAGAGCTLGAGLVVTSSWLAYVAVVAGIAVLWPPVLIVAVPLAAIVAATLLPDLGHDTTVLRTDPGNWLARWTTRGDSLDSAWERAMTWDAALAHTLRWPTWLIGAGPRRMAYDLMHWSARYHVELSSGHAHNEWIETWYEWGIAAPLTVAGLGWRLWPHLHAGDPWSAVVVVGAVLMAGTLAARVTPVGLTWWLACSIVAHN